MFHIWSLLSEKSKYLCIWQILERFPQVISSHKIFFPILFNTIWVPYSVYEVWVYHCMSQDRWH